MSMEPKCSESGVNAVQRALHVTTALRYVAQAYNNYLSTVTWWKGTNHEALANQNLVQTETEIGTYVLDGRFPERIQNSSVDVVHPNS